MNDFLHRAITLIGIALLATLPLGCDRDAGQAIDNQDHAADHGHEHPASDDGHQHGQDHDDEHGHQHDQDHGDEHGHRHPADDDHGHSHGTAGDHQQSGARTDGHTSDSYGIRVKQISSTLYSDTIKIPGIVSQAPDRQAEVSAPSMVRVVALDLPPKSTVRAGQRMAILELTDPEVRQLQMRAVELRAELLAAATERDRNRAYLDVLRAQNEPMEVEIRRVEADLAVLEARASSRQSALNATLDSLKVVGLSNSQLRELKENGVVSTRIEVFAPRLKGSPQMEVSERPVSMGETLAAGSPIYSLVALDRLMAIGEAFEADLADVRHASRVDLPVTLFFPAEGRTVPDLRIVAVEGTLDGANRVTHFLVPFPNRLISEKTVDGTRYLDWENRVGARVQILVATGQVGRRFVIPNGALVREAGRTAVFRKEGDAYHRVFVSVESVDAGLAILPLECGLSEGDEVVVQGALQLKLALQEMSEGGTSTDGSDHGHQH